MHELGVLHQVVKTARRIAEENQIRRIKHITLEVGVVSGFVPQYLTILSVPEGHDKPLKYPLIYETCQLLVINKMDVMPYFDFDREKVITYAKMRNPGIEILFVSTKTREGVDAVADWIERNAAAWNQ